MFYNTFSNIILKPQHFCVCTLDLNNIITFYSKKFTLSIAVPDKFVYALHSGNSAFCFYANALIVIYRVVAII